jgi:hypothetical protein
MVLMSLACILIGLDVPSIYYMIPSLFLFGLSNPLIHTPLMPEMGAIVNQMVCIVTRECYYMMH